MNALLIVAHGSRRAQSNEEVMALTQRVADQASGQFELVDCAFLELAAPLIPDGIKKLADQGASHIKVLPYFLAKGTHVAEDVPAEVDKAVAILPDVHVEVLPYLGTFAQLPSILVDIATEG